MPRCFWVKVVLLCVLLGPCTPAEASSQNVTVTKSPTQTSGGWVNGGEAFVSDNNYTWTNIANKLQIYTGYTFGLPNETVVSQVKVHVETYQEFNEIEFIGLKVNNGSTLGPYHMLYPLEEESTIIIDVTSDFEWTGETINNLLVYLIYKDQFGVFTKIFVDWLPVEVTYVVDVDTGPITGEDKIIVELPNPLYYLKMALLGFANWLLTPEVLGTGAILGIMLCVYVIYRSEKKKEKRVEVKW